ncbi:ATP-binding protein [Streptomyces sp. SID486]|jgi:anti-sigma regulatory factor (Ser/Thr protein kinase)|uniref:ATP-binding protein n=1 Tax=unclassified Streptomyces TaxID=2593676 RepID=UPI0013682033|nr:ATP-binding protein [Streptomyces sp. SID486]MYW22002.1 ATP-binding protein [Streptomyces sp. SID2955]MYX95556.1 ATP-binding protein [Streptomyces sp. SID486]
MLDKHRKDSFATTLPAARHRVPGRPAEARRTVERVMTERCRARALPCPPEAVEDALLVTSELTTNALLHGGGITGFDVDVDSGGVRVSVSDRSDELPVAHPAMDGSGRTLPGGRGWPIVCRLARDVRVAELPRGGKRITAVVPLS